MSGHIGFVFDNPAQNPANLYPPNSEVYKPYCVPTQEPFTPVFTEYAHGQQSYLPAFPDNRPQSSPGPWDNTYPPNIYNGCNTSYENQHVQSDWGLGYNAQQQVTPYGQEHVMATTNYDVEARGYDHHSNGGGGIPGGKLGVVGGAVVAGAGTAMAVQLLPKKFKKNKLVKYGLPLAGAGAAGYKLNQMNNSGGKN